jgi:hypothetical protein
LFIIKVMESHTVLLIKHVMVIMKAMESHYCIVH